MSRRYQVTKVLETIVDLEEYPSDEPDLSDEDLAVALAHEFPHWDIACVEARPL